MTPTTRPALTEPATEAGRALFRDYYAADDARETVGLSIGQRILAIEAEAVQREREALVERVAPMLHARIVKDRGYQSDWSALDDGMREKWTAEARRLLGLDAQEKGDQA